MDLLLLILAIIIVVFIGVLLFACIISSWSRQREKRILRKENFKRRKL